MNQEQAKEIIEKEIKTRWPKWKPSDQLIEDVIFAIKPYDNPDDVLNGIKKYRNGFKGADPRVDDLLAKIKEAVGDRRKTERKEKGEWPGQVFLVVHRGEDKTEDGRWDWHVANEDQEVPYELQSKVLGSHIAFCVNRFGDRFHGQGYFSGEIHTEETFSKRVRELDFIMSSPEEKARRAEIEERLYNGEDPKAVFLSMFKVIEEKVEVPFLRNPRFNPPLPVITPPSMMEAEPRPTEEEFKEQYECHPVVEEPPAPRPIPEPKPKFDPPSWLDENINF